MLLQSERKTEPDLRLAQLLQARKFQQLLALGQESFWNIINVHLTLLIVYNYVDYELEEQWLSIVCPLYITGNPP